MSRTSHRPLVLGYRFHAIFSNKASSARKTRKVNGYIAARNAAGCQGPDPLLVSGYPWSDTQGLHPSYLRVRVWRWYVRASGPEPGRLP